MIASDETIKAAITHLAQQDTVLAAAIKRAGPCTIRPHKNYYQELVDSIISQQLSIKAAATIFKRFKELFGGSFPTPEQILTKEIDELRSVGLSRGKAMYVRDLARHIVDGQLKFGHLDSLSNEEVIAELTAVKGIGEWTAHMFMMFCMGRLDVLAHGDLGIKNGVRKLYGLDHQPTALEVVDIAKQNHWHPYETVACWYVWHAVDDIPAEAETGS
jgi:DNA-3-methyladenine glycosylase II